MKLTTAFALLALFVLATSQPAIATSAAQDALDRLKSMEGTWHGTETGNPEGPDVRHHFRVSANGTVVMETMDSGNPEHEMINMYHLDGDDLVLTHYCAGGNQPTMELVQPSEANELRFDFTGGTNLDPSKDEHIHAARMRFLDGDTFESSWTGWMDGKEAGVKTWVLKRGE